MKLSGGVFLLLINVKDILFLKILFFIINNVFSGVNLIIFLWNCNIIIYLGIIFILSLIIFVDDVVFIV